MSLILTAGMDGEPEPVGGSAFVGSGQATPKRYSERERLMMERRAAFFGRTVEEEVAYWEAILSGQRLPDPNDLELIQRLGAMREKGLLPSQRRAKAVTRLAAIDRLPEGVDVPPPTTVKELCHIYLEYKLKGRRSYDNVRRTIRHTMEQNGFAEVKLCDLTPGMIKRWHASMASRHVTGNNGLKTLRSAFRFCQRLELVDRDPTDKIRRFREEARTRYVLPGEMSRFMYALEAIKPKPRTFFLTTLFTASRPGEVRVMRWRDLDFVGMRWRKPRTKNEAPQDIALNPIVYRLLRQLPEVSDYVFPSKNLSGPWAESTYRKRWKEVKAIAKLPDVTVYDLRRTMASWSAIHGVNLSTIQQMLNHASLQHTHRYAQLDVQTAGRALDGISKHMVASSAGLRDLCGPVSPDELPPDVAAIREAIPPMMSAGPMGKSDDDHEDWSEVPG